MKQQLLAIGILAGSLLLAAAEANAQAQRSGGEAQKFVQQYQQVSAEKTALQAQLTELQKQLDAGKADIATLKKERDALKANAGGSAAAIAQATSEKQTAEQNLALSKRRMTELADRFRESLQNFKETETDRGNARKELADRNAAFDTCTEKNFQLYDVSREILDRYEHVGLFTKASAVEPFTRITRTRIENLVDEYRARAEELRVKKRTP